MHMTLLEPPEIQHNHVQLFIYKITILDTINRGNCCTLAIESKIVYRDKLLEWGAGAFAAEDKRHKKTQQQLQHTTTTLVENELKKKTINTRTEFRSRNVKSEKQWISNQ